MHGLRSPRAAAICLQKVSCRQDVRRWPGSCLCGCEHSTLSDLAARSLPVCAMQHRSGSGIQSHSVAEHGNRSILQSGQPRQRASVLVARSRREYAANCAGGSLRSGSNPFELRGACSHGNTERMVEEVTILELKGTLRLMMACVSFQRGQTPAFPPVSMGRKMGRKKGCHA